ncbi:MAG: hypothetical protein WEB09_02180 [Nitriliruptor sp.]
MAHVLEPAWREGPGQLDLEHPPGYANLPLAVIDAIFAIRANDASARHAVSRYAERFGVPDVGPEHRDEHEVGLDTLVEQLHGADDDALVSLFCDNQRLAARLKAAAVPRAAAALVAVGVTHAADLADPRSEPERADTQEAAWCAVAGCGALSWHAVRHSAGLPDVPPETSVVRWVEVATGEETAPDRAGELLDELATELGIERPVLDHTIARSQRQR